MTTFAVSYTGLHPLRSVHASQHFQTIVNPEVAFLLITAALGSMAITFITLLLSSRSIM